MEPHFILVDFENVQPRSLVGLKDGQHQVRVFLGASQTKISLELAQALQAFGPGARYVQVTGNGSNALDFHIAYYVGRLSALHPGAEFTIVSRDKGFDPLVKHLVGKGIACRRTPQIGDFAAVNPAPAKAAKKAAVAKPAASPKAVPAVKATAAARPTANGKPAVAAKSGPAAATPAKPAADASAAKATVAAVLEHLLRMKTNKPRTVKTLDASIRNWFKPDLDANASQALRDQLAKAGKITIDGSKVSYSLGGK